ncbi:MAG: hypothetical protein IPF58_12905 [Saprospirales bacterium]|nr:hypothetical protein [Saprospirales bacterium]MBK8351278.1 hypothetical protein [Saprospirales bacterium]
MQVLFSKKAYKSILSLEKYLTEEIQMPLTAFRYSNKMETFGKSIAKNPLGYKVCVRPKWNLKNYHCATFDKNGFLFMKFVKIKSLFAN